jgi:hypothetical protein
MMGVGGLKVVAKGCDFGGSLSSTFQVPVIVDLTCFKEKFIWRERKGGVGGKECSIS